jgi:hypothetical protein
MVNTKRIVIAVVSAVAVLAFVAWAYSPASIIDKDARPRCTEQANDLVIRADQLTAKRNSIAGSVDFDGTIAAEAAELWDEVNILKQECGSLIPQYFSSDTSSIEALTSN